MAKSEVLSENQTNVSDISEDKILNVFDVILLRKAL